MPLYFTILAIVFSLYSCWYLYTFYSGKGMSYINENNVICFCESPFSIAIFAGSLDAFSYFYTLLISMIDQIPSLEACGALIDSLLFCITIWLANLLFKSCFSTDRLSESNVLTKSDKEIFVFTTYLCLTILMIVEYLCTKNRLYSSFINASSGVVLGFIFSWDTFISDNMLKRDNLFKKIKELIVAIGERKLWKYIILNCIACIFLWEFKNTALVHISEIIKGFLFGSLFSLIFLFIFIKVSRDKNKKLK